MSEERVYTPRYSGPNRTGICVCGHSWDNHHLGMVMRQEYVDQTKEAYIPQECEYFGFNEVGGMAPDPNLEGNWVQHCSSYRDTKDV